MLTPEQRRQIEQDAARDIRRHYREIQPTTFASVIDDIRHKVVEEGVYGKQVTGNISDAKVVEAETLYATPASHAPTISSPSAEASGLDIHGNPMGNTPRPAEPEAPAIKGPEVEL